MAAPERVPSGEHEDVMSLGPPGDPEHVARIVCLGMLDRRAYTRAELATALRKRGVPADAAGRVLDRFVEVGLVDDAALADGYALAQRRERGLAARAVAEKLRRRGIDGDAIQAAVGQIDDERETAAARALVERRAPSLSGLEPAVQARRLTALLARKGYAPGVAHEVVREVVRDLGDLGDDGSEGGEGGFDG